jgi:hypothetical protein
MGWMIFCYPPSFLTMQVGAFMNKHITALSIALALTLTPLASAQVTTAADAITTADAIRQAVNSAAKESFSYWAFLPGYGIVTKATGFGDWKKDWPAKFASIKTMTNALAATVKGLNGGDWVSYSIVYLGFSENNTTVTGRILFKDLANPNAWEVWVNNTKQ